MQKIKEPWKFLFVYSSFIAIVAIFILGGMLLSPSEASNSLFLGFSLPRLILASGLVVAFVFFAFLSLKELRDREWAEKSLEQWFGGGSRISKVVTGLAGISFVLGWIGCFLPAYRAGGLAVHWARLQPIMVFSLLASIATLMMIFIKRSNFRNLKPKISSELKLSFVMLLVSMLFIGIMLYSRFGVYAPEDYWYGAGVPLLASQLILAIVGGIFFLQIEKRWQLRRSDLLVFPLIYAVTAVLWAHEPLQRSFMFIGP